MTKLRSRDGTNNICGKNLKQIRENLDPPVSQRGLAKKMQVAGYDIDYHVIQGIEAGTRFVTDVEVFALAEVLKVDYQKLFE